MQHRANEYAGTALARGPVPAVRPGPGRGTPPPFLPAVGRILFKVNGVLLSSFLSRDYQAKLALEL